ncbi:sulfurtransferase TusA family protein [Sphingobium sp. B11D3B]|uniref:sulfurtransferase TusA family protein n=1 Tax=Sphingobium sp. B11D3B TaxID=2940575 RepID=UPI002227ACBF|nr:sulfurtransferase TusA family protein [Sphingobium sp. B11D3B]
MTKRSEPARIDARGLKCPWPVLRAARAMRDHDTVLLLADDPVAKIDVPALAQSNGWAIGVHEAESHVEYALSRAGAEET